ncbi:hypothetical protein [Lewinella sp. IMCC34191]|uniref:hypothetical protein n=1 Tax=Lewinella sp. IMCC34191 TaxID=2259172 RepID=UPI0013006618|nr:hypothetical protein [Lewinella sp. IMCC34191]
MRMLCLFLPVFLVCTGMLSAQTVDVQVFFAQTLPPDDVPGRMDTRPLRTPLITAYDLRTETDRFDPARQEYTARLQFAAPGLARAQRDLFRTLREAPDLEQSEARCELVEDLYHAWLRLYHEDRHRKILDSLQRVLDDRGRLYDLDIGRLRLDYDELFDLRTARTDLTLRRQEGTAEDEGLRQVYGLVGDSLTFAEMPTAEQITSLLVSPRTPVYAQAERDYELALIDREIALEQAEERGILDFVQFRYRGNPNDELDQRFHVGLAFRLENSGDRQLKVRSLELEREWIEANGTLEDQMQSARRAASRRELLTAIDFYQQLRRAFESEDQDLARLAGAASARAGVDPQLLLDIEERRLRNLLKLLSAETEVIARYLDWRSDRDELCLGEDGRWLNRTPGG